MNNKNKLFYKIIIIILILGLSIYYIAFPSNSKYFNYIKVKGKRFNHEKFLGRPYGIVISKNNLIIYDDSPLDSNRIKIFDIKTGKIYSSLGKIGKGPGEYLGLWSIDKAVDNDNKICLMDLSLLRYTILDITNPQNVKIDTIINFKEGDPYCPVYYYNKSKIISIGGSLKKGRIGVYNLNGDIIDYKGQLLPNRNEEIPIQIHQQASLGRLKVTPDGKKIVICSLHSDIIDIYNDSLCLIKRFKGPLEVELQYNVKSLNGNMILSYDEDKSMVCYLDIALTNDRIFALYAGVPISDRKYESNILHEYNMDGELVNSFELDHNLVRISVDNNNNLLYGIQFNPLPEIYIYKIQDYF